jgi:4-hydroxy-3-methylbut-2-enyl diphosphate reductase
MHSDKVFVVANIEELKVLNEKIKENKKVGIVIQTTQKIDFLNEVVSYLLPIANELKVFNTICNSTARRQQEAQELAKTSDLMVVVGSKKSANTTHLTEIVSEITKTIHIENKEELNQYKELVEKAINIGVTAGASTPQNVIDEVINQIEKI